MSEFRSFILRTAEATMMVLVVVATLWSALVTGAQANSAYGAFAGIVGFLLGGASGFLFAAVVASYFFLLTDIAQNTRDLLGRSPR